MMDAFATTNNHNSTTNLLTRAIQQARQPNVQKIAAELAEKAHHASETNGVRFAANMAEDHLRRLVETIHKKKGGGGWGHSTESEL